MSITIPSQEEIKDFLDRGVEQIFPSKEEFEEKIKSGEKITIYNGIDPTGPTLHIGHMIILKKLRVLQTWGHEIILLIGDFTAMIGDPTGKGAVRKPLTREEVLENAKLYKKQAGLFLDFDNKENPAILKYNSEWLEKLSFGDVVKLSSEFTVSYMLERDMFQQRMKEGKPVFLHEFMYPLMQGYDSVAMNVDGEIGGNDQMFNMLAGRDMLKTRKKEKYIITMQLLTDTTGKKMGKSEGNMITIQDDPKNMFGKVMSWTDDMIIRGFRLCTDVPTKEIDQLEQDLLSEKRHPMDIKKYLGKSIVATIHGKEEGNTAQQEFESVFQDKQDPTEIEEFIMEISPANIVDILVFTKLAQNKSEAKRFIEQKGVKVNHEVISDSQIDIAIDQEPVIIQRGKRFFAKVRAK